jgi:hypothetical protein
MPLMVRKEGKVKKITENILGTPPNQQKAHLRTPQIREVDMKRVLLMLGMGGMPSPEVNEPLPMQ